MRPLDLTAASAATAKAIAKIDATTVNKRIAELETEKAGIAEAVERGLGRRTEIAVKLEVVARDGSAIADELLAGRPAREAAIAGPDDAALRDESAALGAGLRELSNRLLVADAEIAELRADVRKAVTQASAPLSEALRAEAEAAIERLCTVYAGALAMHHAAPSGPILALEGALRRSLPALIGREGLVDHREAISVPPDVLAALAGLDGLGAAHVGALPPSVPRPW